MFDWLHVKSVLLFRSPEGDLGQQDCSVGLWPVDWGCWWERPLRPPCVLQEFSVAPPVIKLWQGLADMMGCSIMHEREGNRFEHDFDQKEVPDVCSSGARPSWIRHNTAAEFCERVVW